MSYGNKIFVAFDDSDVEYIRMMSTWQVNRRSFNFHVANINYVPYSTTEAVGKRSLMEQMNHAVAFVVIIGENTRNLHEVTRWQIEIALASRIPIIAVNINGKRRMDEELCPQILKGETVIHIPFGPKIMQHTLASWSSHCRQYNAVDSYWDANAYRNLGM